MQVEKLNVVSDLVTFAGQLDPATVLIAGGERLEDIRLVEAARDHGIVKRIILIGREESIQRAVAEAEIAISDGDILSTADDEETAACTVGCIKDGEVDIVLKGNISTPVINRHLLPLAKRSTVSLASVFDAAPIGGGRPMILTDPGVTTNCTFERMVDMIHNALEVAHAVMGIERPRVAVLSANEKQISSLPSTGMGLALAQTSWNDAVVCGPLSFDLATDPGSVAIKGMPDLPGARDVAGRADILVCPGIDAANILYKVIAALAKYGQASIAGITVGFPVPYIILSRADTLEIRLQSIALCSLFEEQTIKRKRSADG